jgi:hypothetical protein
VPRDFTSNGNPRALDRSQAFVLISYRRDDTGIETGRLHDRLATEYGKDCVFMDIHDAPLGIDHVDHLRAQFERCSAVIVIIGSEWMAMTDGRGQRRLEQADDPVRAEVALALQQKHIQVIPLLVQNTSMPPSEELPADTRLLARRNWIRLRPERWDEDVERLLIGLQKTMGAT